MELPATIRFEASASGSVTSQVASLTIIDPASFGARTCRHQAWATLRRGGIRWRETFYPLETLRAGNVR